MIKSLERKKRKKKIKIKNRKKIFFFGLLFVFQKL